MTEETDEPLPATANPDNLYWIMSENKFMYLPTRTLFERPAVQRQVGKEMAHVIETKKVCSNLFWAPGMATYLENLAVVNGILSDFAGNSLLNTYKKPEFEFVGVPEGAGFWLDLGRYLFGDQLDHIIKVLAFKVQHPELKVNHALVIGSYDQGIGKDAFLMPVQTAVGAHNFGSVTAGLAVEWTKKGFTAPILRNVITRISEVHDLAVDRFKFYDMTKDWAASPPEYVMVADKNVKPHHITNAVLPIYSTNHKTDGMYWPAEDRRHYFAWSDRRYTDMQTEEWRSYWDAWGYADAIPRDESLKDEYFRGYLHHMQQGAAYHVVAYLMQPELIAGFNPGARPPQTDAWRAVVSANRNIEDNQLLDVLDSMGKPASEPWDDPERPEVVTISTIIEASPAGSQVYDFFNSPKNSRAWTHRIEMAGYETVDNPDAKDGLWRVVGRRQMVYARRDLGDNKMAAVRFFVRFHSGRPAAEEDFPS